MRSGQEQEMPVNHDNARDASRAVGVRMSRSTRDGEPQVSPVDRKDSSLYVKPSYTINSGVTSVSTVKRFSTRVSALERQRRTKLQGIKDLLI